MKKILFVTLSILISSSLFSTNFTFAETEGVHVSKIITEYTEPGYVSAAILICAGNDPLNHPEIMLISDNDSKKITVNGVVRENICRGETVPIKADDLSSITATLVSPTDPILIDDVNRITEKTYFQGISVDGKTMVTVTSSTPIVGEPSIIEIEFLDPLSNPVNNVIYDISIMQDKKVVFEQQGVRSVDGFDIHETKTLQTDSPLNIQVELQRVGSNIINTSFEESQGEIIEFRTVPEFGTVAGLILAATVSGVIFLSTKTKMQIYR